MAAEVVVAYIALLAVGLRRRGEKRAEVRKTDVVSECCCSPSHLPIKGTPVSASASVGFHSSYNEHQERAGFLFILPFERSNKQGAGNHHHHHQQQEQDGELERVR
jgi:hypothetical protein